MGTEGGEGTPHAVPRAVDVPLVVPLELPNSFLRLGLRVDHEIVPCHKSQEDLKSAARSCSSLSEVVEACNPQPPPPPPGQPHEIQPRTGTAKPTDAANVTSSIHKAHSGCKISEGLRTTPSWDEIHACMPAIQLLPPRSCLSSGLLSQLPASTSSTTRMMLSQTDT